MSEKETNQDKVASTKSAWEPVSSWFAKAFDYTNHLCKTAFALVYIVNGIAIGMFAFGFIHPSHVVASVFGAISVAFAAVQLGLLVNYGVKYQATTKRKR